MKDGSATQGSLPGIIRNDDKLYEGTLTHYFQVVFNHAQNLSRPYHNFRHMTHVMWLCYDACIFYKHALNRRQMRDLLIAALFHDFDHGGMFGNDDLNIERSIRGLRKHVLEEDRPQLPVIEALIRATQYPHLKPLDELDLSAQILSDADVSQALSVAWIQQVIFGLAGEWDNTPADLLRAQESFLSNLRFATAWARERFPGKVIADKIVEVRGLVEILGLETIKAA